MTEIDLPFEILIGDSIGPYVANYLYISDSLKLLLEAMEKDNIEYYVVNYKRGNIKAFGLTRSK